MTLDLVLPATAIFLGVTTVAALARSGRPLRPHRRVAADRPGETLEFSSDSDTLLPVSCDTPRSVSSRPTPAMLRPADPAQ